MNRLPELLSTAISTFTLPVTILVILVGLICMVAGKKIYWLATGLNSFLAIYIGVSTLMNWPAWQDVLAASVSGLLVALLTIALQRISLALNGFFIFGLLVAILINQLLDFESNSFTPVIIFFIAGSAAAFYNLMKPATALTITTAFIGGFAVSCGLFTLLNQAPNPLYLIIAWIVFGIAGIVWQFKQEEKKKREEG